MSFIRHLPVSIVAVGTLACTALLGDFSVEASPGGTGDSGTEGGGGEGSTEAGVISIMPTEVKVGVLRAQVFTAAGGPVTWSIQEGAAGGTIDAMGKYLAPEKPGVIHVIATSTTDPSQKVMATVTVAPLGINPLAGGNGGEGNIDGPPLRAHFRDPSGIAHINGNGGPNRYYVADTGNHTIREYDEQKQMVTTIAGKSGESGTAIGIGDAARFNEPSGIATDAINKRVYINDRGNHCIRVLDVTTRAVTTITGRCGSPGNTDGVPGTPAQFQDIRSISLNGGKTQGGTAPTFLYVCSGGSLRRVPIEPSAGAIGTASTVASFGSCVVAADLFSGGQNTKDIYFNDSSGLHRYSEFDNTVDSPIVPGYPKATPETFADGMYVATGFGNQSDIVLTSRNKAQVFRAQLIGNPRTAVFDAQPLVGVLNDDRVINGPFAVARMGRPTGVDVINEQSGDILIADTAAAAIRAIDTNNNTVKPFLGAAAQRDRVDGPRSTARFTGPFSITSDDAGTFYVGDIVFDGDVLNNTIRKIDASGTISTFSGKPFRSGAPGNTGYVTPNDGIATDATFALPIDLVWLKGNLYVLDIFAQAIRKVDAKGDVTTLAGQLGVGGSTDGIGIAAGFKLFTPTGGFLGGGIATDGTDVFVADPGNFSIRKIAVATGQVTTIAGGTKGNANGIGMAAQFQLPFGLTYDSGYLYIADGMDHTIRRLDLKTNEVTGFIGLSGTPGAIDGDAGVATFKNPSRVRSDGAGNLFVVELPIGGNVFSGLIRRIDIKAKRVSSFAGTAGKIGLAPGPLPSTVNCPVSFTVTPQGDLAFADFCESSLAIIKPL